MRLVPSVEQTGFATTLHDMLSAARVPEAADSWAEGNHGPGRQLWTQLADLGVTALAIPARHGGLDATPIDLVIAAEELGHHAVPGPIPETLATVPTLLAALTETVPGGEAERWLSELAAGRALATLTAPPWLPFAVDADAAELVLLVDGDAVGTARRGTVHSSMDRTRRLYEVESAGPVEICPAVGRALDLGALVCAAQLLGAGRALLEAAVAHARTRVQFGRAIGGFQAVQQRLADVAVGLEFARPLVYAAAVTLTPRDVSAAKVACSDAANRAARAALQVHGAIGYTQEHGLGRWVTKVRALSLSWGAPADHRARVMAELTKGATWN
ncbi:alkylation response protein AidB-like acyl-CoA dehydrogenase [Actinoplanes tereljensis]|uniref:Acyl-CoA dehydrogenase n=1 Tax=Paractinoplanes tereljensis TaxID=571912 RepID=A0A919NRT3_9ACTN|nr:acyl-CoA dehydrogenase family protein [Actinoplanes tereljensis]GIF22814.1 acyl-CoA dehydrogenase [Actinoplanes tereljensis]